MVMTLVNNLKRLRNDEKMTQTDLAQVLHVSKKTISHWETGYSEPSINQLIALADFFNISLDDLTGRDFHY